MNFWARALPLVALLLGTIPALATEEDGEEPPFPAEAQAAGIRAALDNPDPAVQREAFRILAQTGWAHHPGVAQNELRVEPAEAEARLDDPDPDVCRAAIILLENMDLAAGSPARAKIAALCADRRAAVAQAAARALRRTESPGAPPGSPPALGFEEALRQLGDEDWSKRLAAAEALIARRGETREAAQAAALAFANEGRAAPPSALVALLRRTPGPPGTLPAELAALLADADVRFTALAALAQVPAWAGAHAGGIGLLLGDADAAVRAETAHALALGHAGAPFARSLAACLADPDAQVRENAAEALGQAGPAAAAPYLPALTGLLSDPEPNVRLGAVRALSFLDETATHAEEIVALLGTKPTGRVAINRDPVSAALMRLTEAPPAALRALAARCADPDPEVRVLAIEVLGSMSAGFAERVMRETGETGPENKPWADLSRWSGGPAAAFAPTVAARLDDPDRDVRRVALETLASMGREGAAFAREAAARLRDRDPEMRCVALRALGRMGKPALPFAREIAARGRDPEPGVRAEAAHTLGLLPGDFTARLLELVRDPAAEVRHAALGTLDGAALARPPVTATILACLEDRDEGVREAAARQLDQLAQRHPPFLARFAARLGDRNPAARQATIRRLDSIARETEEAGPARDLLVAVLRVLPALNEEERARLRAHLHVWAGQFFQQDKRPCLQPAVAWLGRPRRTPSLSSLDMGDARELLAAFREVWDGTDGKRDAALRRETAQRVAEVAAALPARSDEATTKVLEEWSARLGSHPDFKDCRRAVAEAAKRGAAAP